MEGDLLATLAGAAAGELGGTPIRQSAGAAVTIVLAAAGYPETGARGTPITGVEAAEAAGALVFHSGTALQDGQLLTNGGRILGVTGVGPDVAAARTAAYAAAELVSFPGARRREDIALPTAADGS